MIIKKKYHIIYEETMHDDVKRIKNCDYGYHEKIMQKIEKDIMNLELMPRIHKTLNSVKDPNGEYRRMVSGKYSIIYKINEDEIIILRIFNQKENYLNPKNFILREKSPKYFLKKEIYAKLTFCCNFLCKNI